MNIHRLSKHRLIEVLEAADPEQKWVKDTETNGLEVIGHCPSHTAWWIGLSPLGTHNVFIISIEEYEEWHLE